WLLGAVPARLPARRGGGAGPPRLPVWRGGRGRLPDRPDSSCPDHDQYDRFRLDRPGRGRTADEPAGEPPGSAGVLRPRGRLLPPAGRWWTRAVPDDLHRAGQLRQGGSSGPRHPERAALPEPDRGWGRPAGHGPAGPERGYTTGLSAEGTGLSPLESPATRI